MAEQIFKMQIGDLYIEFPIDENMLDYVNFVIDTLQFTKQQILKEQKKRVKSDVG